MNLSEVINKMYLPAIAFIGVADTLKARVITLTIGLQESQFIYRRQMNNGPAMGFWQFERGGGVVGVLSHATSKQRAIELCKARNVNPTPNDVWIALQHDDILAAGFTRLLLLTDARALPEIGNVQGAWDCYNRNWRPGKPHPETWAGYYKQAREEVGT